SLDLVSLAGLALAAGMLVDNSIVVLESIHVAARERRAEDPIVDGTRQIAMALVASLATTAVVFLPLIYLRGLARAFFGVQAFAIVSTLLVSLALSLSLTPVLARRFGAHRAFDPARGRGAGRQPGRAAYLRGLGAVLRRPGVTVTATLLILVAVAAAAPRLPRELVPRSAVAEVTAEVRLPAGLEPPLAAQRLGDLDAALAPHLEAHGAAWRLRMREKESSRAFAAYRGPAALEETARLEVRFPNPAALDDALPRLAATSVPGADVRFERRKSAVAAAVERTARALEVEISASTPERLAALEDRVRRSLTAGGWRVEADADAARRTAWWLRFDDVRLARLGASADPLRRQLRAGLEPRALGRARIDGAEPDILFDAGGELARAGAAA
ncbi:MAG: efflux RND transporter permease subunit, partial [Acidobacteriota bacterium]